MKAANRAQKKAYMGVSWCLFFEASLCWWLRRENPEKQVLVFSGSKSKTVTHMFHNSRPLVFSQPHNRSCRGARFTGKGTHKTHGPLSKLGPGSHAWYLLVRFVGNEFD